MTKLLEFLERHRARYLFRSSHLNRAFMVCGFRDHRSGIWNPQPWNQDHQFWGDQESSYAIFVGPEVCQAFGISDQNLGVKNGISDGTVTSCSC